MKNLLLINTLLFILLLGLGVYSLGWDAQIHAEFSRVGWEDYDGLDVDFIENTYSVILTLVACFSVYLGILLAPLESEQPRLLKTTTTVAITLFVIGLFTIGFGIFWYSTDGSTSMEEGQLLWGGLCILNALFSFGLFYLIRLRLFVPISTTLDDPNAMIHHDEDS